MARMNDHQLAVWRNAHGENVPVPPKPKKRGNEESRIQMAVIKWWAFMHTEFGIPEHMLYAIPNGGRRDVIGAAILKKEGQRNGVCDLFLAVPKGKYHGLFIELKTETGVVSEAQTLFICDATKQGYAAYVSRSYDAAVKLITGYLTKPEELF